MFESNQTPEWRCGHCTFINAQSVSSIALTSADRLLCEMCGRTSSREEVSLHLPPHFKLAEPLPKPKPRQSKLLADQEREHRLERFGLLSRPARPSSPDFDPSNLLLFSRFSSGRLSERRSAAGTHTAADFADDSSCQGAAAYPVLGFVRPYVFATCKTKRSKREKSPVQNDSATVESLASVGECPVCTDDKQLLQVPMCGCAVCGDCLCQSVEVRLRNDSSVSGLTCPVCSKLDDEALMNTSCEYFPQLRSLLTGRLKPALMAQLDDRLRDWRLKLTDSFCWCSGCSNGFEVSEHYDRQVRCPLCAKETCRKCGQAWHERHRGVSCQQFASWRQQTDAGQRGLAEFLDSRGSKCPKCGFQFELSRGGCLHMKCSSCLAEFCSDCGSLFVRNECCSNKGLHCHHGNECIDAYRDWPIERVRQAALERGVQLTMSDGVGSSRCRVQEQRETNSGLLDAECGKPAIESGLCEWHLKEAFVSAMRRAKDGKPKPELRPEPRPALAKVFSKRPWQLELSALTNKPSSVMNNRSEFLSESSSRESPRIRDAWEASTSPDWTAGGAALSCPHCTALTPSAPRISGGSRLLCTVCGKSTPSRGGADAEADLRAMLNSFGLADDDAGIELFG